MEADKNFEKGVRIFILTFMGLITAITVSLSITLMLK